MVGFEFWKLLQTVMKHLTIVMLSVSMLVVAQNPHPGTPLEEMVASERAFAKMSEEKGTAPSFLAFIAEDGILFRPKAVKGKQWMIENPPPASDKRPWLKWEPTFAHMARSGDMGYTFGPWEYRRDIKDAEAVAFGHFLTVWTKQPDGTWKFAVDLGISHPKHTTAPTVLDLPSAPIEAPAAKMVNVKSETEKLLSKDKDISKESAASTASAAFEKNATNDVRLFREGKFPMTGRKLAMAALAPNVWIWVPEAAGVSGSGDLGYSYGTYELRDAAKLLETGNYMRIWKKEGGKWKIAVDLANPIVDGKKLNFRNKRIN